MTKTCENCWKAFEAGYEEAEKAYGQRIVALETALREGEWSYYTVDGDPTCGFCWALPFDDEGEPGVHSDDCLFAKPAIRAAIGGRDGDLAVCPGCGHTEKACTCDEVME